MSELRLSHCIIIANMFTFFWFITGATFHIFGNWFLYTGIASWPIIAVTLAYFSFKAWDKAQEHK